MAERIPQLNGLRAFEAAARRMSFQDAAEELGVSASAVSHQIRGLEDYLGARLFERRTRAVALTEAGRRLAPGLSEGFRKIESAVREARSLNAPSQVVLSTNIALTAKWLSPRLYRFEEAHPSVELRISMSNRAVDLNRDDVDIALRHGPGRYPGFDSYRLFGEAYAPLCAPSLASTLKAPDDLRGHRLFEDVMARSTFATPGWSDWFEAVDIDASGWPAPRTFAQTDHALQAAIDGAGVLLGRLAIASIDLEAGRLAQPFDQIIPSPNAYYAVMRKGRFKEKAIRAVVDWLQAEAAPMVARLP